MYRLKDISLSGVLPLKIHSVSATSRYSGKQDSQEQSERVNERLKRSRKITEVILKEIFDLSSFEGLQKFYAYLEEDLLLQSMGTEISSSKKIEGALHYFHMAE